MVPQYLKECSTAEEAFKVLPTYIYENLNEEELVIPELGEYNFKSVKVISINVNDEDYYEFTTKFVEYNNYESYITLRYDKHKEQWEIGDYEEFYTDYSEGELWKHLYFTKRLSDKDNK